MAVGKSYSSEVELSTEAPLNRAAISTMIYLIGALNFLTIAVASLHCCYGCCLYSRDSEVREATSSSYPRYSTLSITKVEIIV